MGYYSKVVIGLSEEANQKFQKELEILKADEKQKYLADKVEKLLSFAEKKRYNAAYIYQWDWIKWYSGFREVEWIEDFINPLDLEEFRFLRIGEENGDIDFRGWNEDANFEPVTDVHFY